MNFLSRITGGGSQEEATPPQSPASKSFAQSDMTAPGSKNKSENAPLLVRLKPYTGLEIKTLWNHFNKDDLITVSELSELLDRIMIKDSTDIYTAIKGSKGWKDYCSQAMKVMDTSRGNTIDLQEFSGGFNGFYQTRFYFSIKHIIPALLKELKRICQECELDAVRLSELAGILAGDATPAPQPVIDNASKDEIKNLKSLIDKLNSVLAQSKSELMAAQGEIGQLKESLARSETQYSDLLSRFDKERSERLAADAEMDRLRRELRGMQSFQDTTENQKKEIERLRMELDATQEDLHKAREENRRLVDQNRDSGARFEAEQASLRRALENRDNEILQLQQESDKLERESQNIRNSQGKLVDEWRMKFDDILKENDTCRTIMAELRSEIIRVNTALYEAQNAEKEQDIKVSSIHAASLSGIGLDPFRTELVRQFGSIDAALGKRKRVTLHELEAMATTMGYSREYSRKLFYALDVKNRGFLSGEQFARPLPLLNRELCLLTQAQIEPKSIKQTN